MTDKTGEGHRSLAKLPCSRFQQINYGFWKKKIAAALGGITRTQPMSGTLLFCNSRTIEYLYVMEQEFEPMNIMGFARHLQLYGYITLHSSDVNRLLKLIEDNHGIKAMVKRKEEGWEPGKRKYFLINPEVWKD